MKCNHLMGILDDGISGAFLIDLQHLKESICFRDEYRKAIEVLDTNIASIMELFSYCPKCGEHFDHEKHVEKYNISKYSAENEKETIAAKLWGKKKDEIIKQYQSKSLESSWTHSTGNPIKVKKPKPFN